MAIYDLYSKRQEDLARDGQEDIYQFSDVSSQLRVQIKQIVLEAVGPFSNQGDFYVEENDWYERIERIFLREKGVERIAVGSTAGERLFSFMAKCSTEDWLDLLDILARIISVFSHDDYKDLRRKWGISVKAEDAIFEMNHRLRRARFGYQIESGKLLRVDAQFIHAEVVRPALSLLTDDSFEGARQEFMAAHSHYRAGENRQAISMAANALESTFKAVFDKKGWEYNKGARISDLVKVAKAKHLWPDFLDGSFDQLVATLQSGLPKIRDNQASHGQGVKPLVVPDYIAAYALHLAASKIVFVVEAAKYEAVN